MFSKASIIALLTSVAAAQHAAVGQPAGNPITRPLNEVVPACKAFTITWEPTTPNSVSLILLRGPATNVVPLGAPLAVGIPNSGSFTWTPSSALEADETHYGLQLIDDVNGQYQYSTQFGISKVDCGVESSSAVVVKPTASVIATSATSVVAKPVSTATGGYGYPVESSAASSSVVKSSTVVVKSSATPAVTPVAPYPTTVGTASHVASTGVPANSTMIIMPTGSMTVPESLRTSATGSSTLPESTGAASGLKAGLSFVGAAAIAAFMF